MGILLLIFALPSTLALAAKKDLAVTADGHKLHVRRHSVDKTFYGDSDFRKLSDYQVKIPLSELKPSQADVPVTYAPFSAIQKSMPGISQNREQAELPSTAPIDEETLARQANELFYAGRFAEALVKVDQLLKLNPDSARGWLMRGSLMYVLGEKHQATAAWEKGRMLDPNTERPGGAP